MRCPKCGPRPGKEFRRVLQDVAPAADGRLVPVDVWTHTPASCRRKVYTVKKPILASS